MFGLRGRVRIDTERMVLRPPAHSDFRAWSDLRRARIGIVVLDSDYTVEHEFALLWRDVVVLLGIGRMIVEFSIGYFARGPVEPLNVPILVGPHRIAHVLLTTKTPQELTEGISW